MNAVDTVARRAYDEITKLYDMYGIQPNAILLSREQMGFLKEQCHLVEFTNEYIDRGLSKGEFVSKLFGIKIHVIKGEDVVKAAILLEDE